MLHAFIQACKRLQYKLPMEQEPSSDEIGMMKQMNDAIMASIGSPKSLQELANGAVYLQMIAIINPKIISMSSINFGATSLWESFQNFTVLSRILEEKEFSFVINIQKLAQADIFEHFKFFTYFFQVLRKPTWKDSMIKERKISLNTETSQSNQLPSQRLPFKPSSNFFSASTSQIQQTTGRNQFYDAPSAELEVCSKNMIVMSLVKAKELNKSYMNTFKVGKESRMNFYCFIRNITVHFLNSQTFGQLNQHQKQAIDECLSVHKSFKSIQYLLYGKNDTDQDEQTSKAYTNIRKRCLRYYQSIDFIHEIVGNQLRKMRFKLLQIAYLHKLQLYAQKKLTRKQLECVDISELVVYFQSDVYEDDSQIRSDFAFSPKRTSQNAMEERRIAKQLQKTKITTKAQATGFDNNRKNQGYAERAQSSRKFEEEAFDESKEESLSQSQDCSDQLQYWNIHRITMIAYELQYVHHKDPEYMEDDEFFYKRTDHTKYVTGFIFTSLCKRKKGKNKKKLQQVINHLIKSQEYPNLSRLFGKKQEKDEGLSRLAEFVRILLSLKHDAVRHEFAQIYDSIVAEVRSVTFAEVKGRRDRFAFVEGVTAKLRQIAAEIDDALRGMLSLDEGGENATSLIRTSVYCLLAERFAFHTNELWPVAFPSSKAQNRPKQYQDKEQSR